MDKLTTEQKAERYDKAIEVAKRKLCFDNAGMIDNFTPDDIREIFPELKKPEDEEIRKYVINIVNQWWDRLGDPSPDYPTQEDMLNWLEKQGEQNLIMAKSPQLGKQKPANNNELKFKIGDWVVVDGITQKVTHIRAEGFDTDRAWNGKSTFKDVHLWTIADVKDCDVLVDVYGNIGIYKSHDDFSWLSYCSLGYYGGFQYFTIEHDNEKTYPATKEQRDTLFKAMADAEYTFDFEKKELKKISQRMISAEAKEAMYGKPTAWSEEDEEMLDGIILRCEKYGHQEQIDWLKSLKQRIKL